MLIEKFIISDYLKENGAIQYPDMVFLRENEHIPIPLQAKILKILEKEEKARDESKSATEPFFTFIRKKSLFEAYGDKPQNVREKMFKYLHENNGRYSEIQCYMEYGISYENQKRMLEMLTEEGSVIKTAFGYEIKKKK